MFFNKALLERRVPLENRSQQNFYTFKFQDVVPPVSVCVLYVNI